MYRTKTCGELNINNAGEKVELAGWIQKKRNLGGMEFIDLRDEFGITQIIINDEKLQEQAKEFTTESCIHVEGKVVERSNKNKNIKTGEIEVIAEKIMELPPPESGWNLCYQIVRITVAIALCLLLNRCLEYGKKVCMNKKKIRGDET